MSPSWQLNLSLNFILLILTGEKFRALNSKEEVKYPLRVGKDLIKSNPIWVSAREVNMLQL